jgi:hypothetical protein
MWTAGRCCVESTRFRDFAFGFFFAWWGFGIANQNVTVAIYALVTKKASACHDHFSDSQPRPGPRQGTVRPTDLSSVGAT